MGSPKNDKLQKLLLIIIVVIGSVVLVKTIARTELPDPMGLQTKRTISSSLYTGPSWVSERTISRQVIADTRFARCEIHKVRTEDGTSVINDWLWFDEKDAVNVAVRDENGRFVLMKQKKYGLKGTTLSPVGGMVEDGETAFEAAKREVFEELGMGSRRTLQMMKEHEIQPPPQQRGKAVSGQGEDDGSVPSHEPDWHYFGVYRTAANRGGGMSHLYLLNNAIPLLPDGGTSSFRPVGDGEEQKILYMTVEETKHALKQAEFKEIKWAATISFALLQLQDPTS